MNMATTGTVQRDDAAECRAAKHVPQDTLREVREKIKRAQVNIGAQIDTLTDVQKEVAVNQSWHILNEALATLDRVIEGEKTD